MKPRIAALILLMSAISLSGFAQGGLAGLSFLKIGVGGRSPGMGEAAVAAVNDPSATQYNPAALRRSSNTQLLIMHREWLEGSRTEFLAASFAVEPLTVGVFLNATSVPGIEIRRRPGPAEGTFTARNAAIGASVAYSIEDRFDAGLSLKYLYEKIFVDEANGIGVDVGALYRLPWNLSVGLSLANLGSMSTLRSESSKLPTTLRIGVARTETVVPIDGTVTFAADVVSIFPEKKTHLHVGTELAYQETFFIRLGYMSGFETKDLSAGIGIRFDIIRVDYAYVPLRLDFGSAHVFSLMIDL